MSWPLHSIGDFCLTGSGGTPSRLKPEYFEGNIPWIKSGDLRENVVEIANEFITEDAVKNSSAKIVPNGAILVAMYGATVGRMAILGIDAATNQAVCNVIPNEKFAFQKYVYYALLSKVPEFLQNAVGGAQPNISQGMIRDTKIPLPPLEEQKRIAAILDKADAIRRKRQQAIKLADEFLRAVFLDMFGDPLKWDINQNNGWAVKPIGEICYLKRGYDLPVQDRNEGQFPIYAANGIVGYHDASMAKGPGVITGRSGTLGKVIYTDNDYWPLNTSLYVKDFCGNEPKYIEWFLRMFQLDRYHRGAGVPTLNRNLFLDELSLNPPLDLQIKFVKKIKKAEAVIEKMSSNIDENFFNALSHKIFS